MPTYQFVCCGCGKFYEVSVPLAEYVKGFKPKCPHCGAEKATRVFTSVNVKTRSKTGADSGDACAPGCSCGAP